jgi:sugar (glycoside-pentoside-hexuronide) transporter
MSAATEKPSVLEKLSYAAGDGGANLIFQTQISFLLFFYTDVAGIPAAVAGTILMVSRIVEALTDPVIGALADRTATRWGRYRPWIIGSALPLAAALILCYTTPDLAPRGKIVWAFATYILLMVLYAANNIPYCALSGVMTDDSEVRTSLQSWRFLFAMAGTLLASVFTIDLVERLGAGNRASGYRAAMSVWALLALTCFLVTFFYTRERIEPVVQQQSSIRQRLSNLCRLGPWVALFSLGLLIHIQLSLRSSALLHYFAHYLHREDLYGEFNGIGLGVAMIGVFLAQPLAAKFGKRNTFQACLVLSAIFMALFAAVPPDAVRTLFVVQVLMQLAFGPTIPLLWTMMADVADYAEWKTGQRSTALAFASIVFGLKLGLGLGALVSGAWLEFVDYSPSSSQTATATRGVVMLVSVFPAIALLLGSAVLFFYRIDSRLEEEVKQTLRERRKELQP